MKIKTISKLFIFSAFFLTVAIKTSFAQNIPANLYINANDVFIRETPTTSGKILGRLYFAYSAKFLKKTDNKVKIGKWNNYWYQIKIEINNGYQHIKNITGWVYGEFISFKEPKYKTKYRVVNDKALNEALYKAVTDKNIALALELLKKGADPNYIHVKSDGTTTTQTPVLLNAIRSGSLQLIKILLEHGSNPNLEERIGNHDGGSYTLLVTAISGKNVSLIKLLLEYGSNPDTVEYSTSSGGYFPSPISTAIATKNIEIVRLLINKNVSLNIGIYMGRTPTPLKYAIDSNLPEIAALLKKHGAKLVVEEDQ